MTRSLSSPSSVNAAPIGTQTLIKDEHIAGPSMAGYLYQLSYALLQMFDLDEEESVGVEIIDDVSVQIGLDPKKSIQLKYSTPKQNKERDTKLTDSSPGLWKTLGIWADAILSGRIELNKIKNLILISVAPLPKRSIAQLIANNNQSPSKDGYNQIVERLRTTKQSSQNILMRYYDAVRELDTKHLLYPFVEKIVVKGNQPGLVESSNFLRKRIKNCGFHPRFIDDVAKYLEGWLFEKVAEGLESRQGVQISCQEFRNEHCRLHDKMHGNELIVRYDTWDRLQEFEILQQENKHYILHLTFINATPEDKYEAITDYFKAVSERTEWISRLEISQEQLVRYDRRLIESWKPRFKKMRMALDSLKGNEVICRKGLEFFYEMQIQSEQIHIQPDWQYGAYLSRGSYHMLANELNVGWHPNFSELFNNISCP